MRQAENLASQELQNRRTHIKKVVHLDPHFSLAMLHRNGQESLTTVEPPRAAAAVGRTERSPIRSAPRGREDPEMSSFGTKRQVEQNRPGPT